MTAPTTSITVGEWLRSASVERIDAESLLCHALNKPRSYLFSHSDVKIDSDTLTTLNENALRRQKGEPLAYITGSTEFWSMSFVVNSSVLIPRDDTGCLVETALSLWPTLPSEGLIIDAGTGSGAVAIAVAAEKHASVLAIDNSMDALAVAQENVTRLCPELVTCAHGHWLDEVEANTVRLLLSNPPYIRMGDPHLKAVELTHEPQSALVADSNGLADLTHLALDSHRVLVPNGVVALEHGFDQAEQVRAILTDMGLNDVTTVQDLGGNDRVSYARQSDH